MKVKKDLEQEYIDLQSKKVSANSAKYDYKIAELQEEITVLDEEIVPLIKKQQSYFNPRWDRVFRAGAEESYFAFQVERFACIYMEKLADLLGNSPFVYYRAHRRLMAHDI